MPKHKRHSGGGGSGGRRTSRGNTTSTRQKKKNSSSEPVKRSAKGAIKDARLAHILGLKGVWDVEEVEAPRPAASLKTNWRTDPYSAQPLRSTKQYTRVVLPPVKHGPMLTDEATLRAQRWKCMQYIAPLLQRVKRALGTEHRLLNNVVNHGRLRRPLDASLIHALENANTVTWTRSLVRHEFVSAFVNYLASDVGRLASEVNDLFTSFDANNKEVVDFREVACCMRLVTHPGEPPAHRLLWFFDTFQERTDDGRHKGFMMTRFLEPILAVPATNDDDMRGFMPEIYKLENRLGRPTPRYILRDQFISVLEQSPDTVDKFHRVCLTSMPRDYRLAVAARLAAGKATLDLGPAAGSQLRLDIIEEARRLRAAESAAAMRLPGAMEGVDKNSRMLKAFKGRYAAAELGNVRNYAYGEFGAIKAFQNNMGIAKRMKIFGLSLILARYEPKERLQFMFDHWRKRTASKVVRWEDQALAGEYYVNRLLLRALRWWAHWNRLLIANRKAKRMAARRWKRRCFGSWKKFCEVQLVVRENKTKRQDAAMALATMRADISQAELDRIFWQIWSRKVFDAIKWIAWYNAMTRYVRQFRAHRLLVQCFRGWKERMESRKVFRNDQRIKRAVEENKRKNEADAKRMREIEEEKVAKAEAKAKEAYEREWKEKAKKAEEYFDIRRAVEIARERAAKAHEQAKVDRANRFNAHFDAIVAAKYKEITDLAMEYLSEPEGKRVLKGFMGEHTDLLSIKASIEKDLQRWQNGFVWEIQWDWKLMVRYWKHKESGDILYAKFDTGVPKEQKMSKKQLKQMAIDNYIGRKQFEANSILAVRRKKELAIEHRNHSAGMLQKLWRRFKYSHILMEGVRAAIARGREEAKQRNLDHLEAMATLIQRNWRATKVQGLLAGLVWGMIEIKTDPTDNSTYYYNKLSGKTTHEVPAILKSRLTGNIHKLIDMEPDWVLVEVEAGDKGMTHYYNKRLDEKRFRPPQGYFMCADCERYRFAIRFCPKCGDHYCMECYKAQHRRGGRANHAWIPVPVKPVYCSWCNKNKATLKCYECGGAKPYCVPCHRAVHIEQEEYAWHDVMEM